MKTLLKDLYVFLKRFPMKVLYQNILIAGTLGLIFLFASSSPIFAQSDFTITVDVIQSENFEYPDAQGLLTVTFMPGDSSAYLSLGAEDPDTYQFGIIVDNLYLPSKEEEDGPVTLTVPFNLIQLSPHNVAQSLNKNTINDFPDFLKIYIHLFFRLAVYPYDPSTWIGTQEVTVGEINEDAVGVEVGNAPEPEGGETTPTVITINDSELRASYHRNVPNLDLDDSSHGDTETYAGDLNACAPTAFANSMAWLENTYDQVDLPENLSSLRDVMEDLSGKFNRERNKGTSGNNQQKGALDFVESYDLPVEVKFQSRWENENISSSSGESTARDMSETDNTPPTWEFLMQMMEEGENVTINYQWFNPGDNKWYSHAVCMTGAREYSESGTKRISFRHDGVQGSTGGLRHDNHDITVDANGWMRFGPGNSKYIDRVIAKSPLVPEGEEESGFLNEVFNFFGLSKNIGTNDVNNDFIEIVLNENVDDLENFRITLYKGSDGTVYETLTLDEFTPGTTNYGLTSYSYMLINVPLVDDFGGISLAYTGSIIPGQFLSYGGTFVATQGDAIGIESVNIGTLEAGKSLVLSGTGEFYKHFTWTVSESPTPGDVNTGQEFAENTTDIETPENIKPLKFELAQNYPNPFNPATTIHYVMPEDGIVTLTIYNITGEQVYQLADQNISAGSHSFNWDASQYPSGFYFYSINVQSIHRNEVYSATKKMILLK